MFVEVPLHYVTNPKQNVGISSTFVNNNDLKKSLMFVFNSLVVDVKTESVIIQITVAEPYFERFYFHLSKVKRAEIIKGAEYE